MNILQIDGVTSTSKYLKILPHIKSITPNEGSLKGGVETLVTGGPFAEGEVDLTLTADGGVTNEKCLKITYVSASKVICLMPPNGAVMVS